MSIEAIKEALAAGPTEGPWTVEVGGSPSVAIANDVMLLAKTLGDNDDANAAFIAACNPVAIRSLIERLEAAEKDAARAEWLAVRERFASVCVGFCRDGGYRKHRVVWYEGDTEKWMEAEGDSFEAAIDSAMETSK